MKSKLSIWCWLVLTLTISQLGEVFADSTKVQRFDTAILITEDSRQVELRHHHRGDSSTYNLSFDRFHNEMLWAIYVESRQWHVKVWVNDVFLGEQADRDLLKPNWLTPAIFVFPQDVAQ